MHVKFRGLEGVHLMWKDFLWVFPFANIPLIACGIVFGVTFWFGATQICAFGVEM
jgi:hypothetical protein